MFGSSLRVGKENPQPILFHYVEMTVKGTVACEGASVRRLKLRLLRTRNNFECFLFIDTEFRVWLGWLSTLLVGEKLNLPLGNSILFGRGRNRCTWFETHEEGI